MSSVDNKPPDSDDEITLDPEATNAADANWLAELRAKARTGGQSMAELLDDDSETVDDAGADRAPNGNTDLDDDDDDDDEATIDHRSHGDAIRQAVTEARAVQEAADDMVIEAAPQVPEQTTAPVAPHPASTASTSTDVSPTRPPPGEATVPRWEAPPRLDTGRQATSPALIRGTTSQRRFDWRIVAAVAVALLAGFAIALFVFGGSDEAPTDDPNATTTIVDNAGATDTEEP